jgi:dienelactone hydrolase
MPRSDRYEGAHHAFDNKSLAWGVLHSAPSAPSPRGCTFVERDGVIIDADTGSVAEVGSTCVEFGISYGYDAEARTAAERDLLGFLDDIFGP